MEFGLIFRHRSNIPTNIPSWYLRFTKPDQLSKSWATLCESSIRQLFSPPPKMLSHKALWSFLQMVDDSSSEDASNFTQEGVSSGDDIDKKRFPVSIVLASRHFSTNYRRLLGATRAFRFDQRLLFLSFEKWNSRKYIETYRLNEERKLIVSPFNAFRGTISTDSGGSRGQSNIIGSGGNRFSSKLNLLYLLSIHSRNDIFRMRVAVSSLSAIQRVRFYGDKITPCF